MLSLVDRIEFSRRVAELIAAHPKIEVRREEVTHLDETDADTITILASGPLTSSPLAAELQRLTGEEQLAFYDSISPIVDASSIDMEKVYFAARWDKGTADYINCPFTKEEYETFMDALTAAETVEAKAWEALPTDGSVTAGSVTAAPVRDELLRRLSAHRRDGAARSRHPAVWAHETRRPDQSEDRPLALCGGAVAPGKPSRR